MIRRTGPSRVNGLAGGRGMIALGSSAMTDPLPEQDGAPFPEPRPEETGFGPLDADNFKEWNRARRRWEAEHGPPRS